MEPCALAVALAAWFVGFLIIWMASPDRWLTDHLFGWLPWQLRQLSSVAGGGLAGMEFVALMILAFVGNGFAGPVTEKLYFRGHLLFRVLGSYGSGAPIIRASLFALYHVWTPWWWPQIMVGFLPIAWQVRRRRSVYLGAVAHVLINNVFLLLTIAASLWGNAA